MPAIPPPLPLLPADLARVKDYLGNERHRNHRGYRIQAPVARGVATADDFVSLVCHAIDVINLTRSGKERIRVAGQWYVFSFAEKSCLSDVERAAYQDAIFKVLGDERPFLSSWHVHKRTGRADLNIIDPEIRLSPVPLLDRPRTINRLHRLRHASDAWAIAANRAREEGHKAPIPCVDPIADSAANGLARLVRLITKHLPTNANSFGKRQLPEALKAAGFRREDWHLSIAGILAIHQWPTAPAEKTKPRPFHVAVRDLVTWAWLHVVRRSRKNSVGTRSRKHTHGETPVIPAQRTAPDVLQRRNEPEI